MLMLIFVVVAVILVVDESRSSRSRDVIMLFSVMEVAVSMCRYTCVSRTMLCFVSLIFIGWLLT